MIYLKKSWFFPTLVVCDNFIKGCYYSLPIGSLITIIFQYATYKITHVLGNMTISHQNIAQVKGVCVRVCVCACMCTCVILCSFWHIELFAIIFWAFPRKQESVFKMFYWISNQCLIFMVVQLSCMIINLDISHTITWKCIIQTLSTEMEVKFTCRI